MNDKRFSAWVVLLFLAVALVIATVSLGSGLFFGYQWGKSAGRAQAIAEVPSLLPRAVGPLLKEFFPRLDRPEIQRADRPFLGVSFQIITEELAEREDLPADQGAWITEVVPGSPADEAGLRVGDIIHAVNGQAVNDDHPLPELIIAHRPGDRIELQILRGDGEHSIEVELGARPGSGFMDESVVPGEVFPRFHFEFQCFPQPCPFLEDRP
jgi:membrane-associated protease RseP (regulator of RpoE activity)